MGAREHLPLEAAPRRHIERQGTDVAFYERMASLQGAVKPRH